MTRAVPAVRAVPFRRAAVGLTFHPERRRNPKVTHPLPIPDYATPETRAEIESHNAANRDIESDLAAVRQRQEVADQADPRTANPGELAAEREAIVAARKKLLASKIALLQARLSLLGRLEAERLAGEQAAGPAIGTAREAARTALRAAGYGRYFGDSNPNVIKRQAESWVDMAEDVLSASARYERLRQARVALLELRQTAESEIRRCDESAQAATLGRGVVGFSERLLASGAAR